MCSLRRARALNGITGIHSLGIGERGEEPSKSVTDLGQLLGLSRQKAGQLAGRRKFPARWLTWPPPTEWVSPHAVRHGGQEWPSLAHPADSHQELLILRHPSGKEIDDRLLGGASFTGWRLNAMLCINIAVSAKDGEMI